MTQSKKAALDEALLVEVLGPRPKDPSQSLFWLTIGRSVMRDVEGAVAGEPLTLKSMTLYLLALYERSSGSGIGARLSAVTGASRVEEFTSYLRGAPSPVAEREGHFTLD